MAGCGKWLIERRSNNESDGYQGARPLLCSRSGRPHRGSDRWPRGETLRVSLQSLRVHPVRQGAKAGFGSPMRSARAPRCIYHSRRFRISNAAGEGVLRVGQEPALIRDRIGVSEGLPLGRQNGDVIAEIALVDALVAAKDLCTEQLNPSDEILLNFGPSYLRMSKATPLGI